MNRQLQKDINFLEQCSIYAKLSTCHRRRVACIVTDVNGIILSVGRNGVPKGFDHCVNTPCAGADKPSGTGLDQCLAIHAEINALMFCSDINKIDTLYVTVSPCIQCIKAILNTSCKRIVYAKEYASEHHGVITTLCRNRIKLENLEKHIPWINI